MPIEEKSVLEAPREVHLLQGSKWWKPKYCPVSVTWNLPWSLQLSSYFFFCSSKGFSFLFGTQISPKDSGSYCLPVPCYACYPTAQRQDTHTGCLLNIPTDPACWAPFLHHYLLKALIWISFWVFHCCTGHNEGNRCGVPASRGLQSQAAGQTLWAQMSAQA